MIALSLAERLGVVAAFNYARDYKHEWVKLLPSDAEKVIASLDRLEVLEAYIQAEDEMEHIEDSGSWEEPVDRERFLAAKQRRDEARDLLRLLNNQKGEEEAVVAEVVVERGSVT